MALRTLLIRTLLLISATLISITSYAEDDIRTLLFFDADATLSEAKIARAAILSPTNYEKGYEYYVSASNRLKKGHSIERITKDLKKSNEYLQKAMEVVRIANVTLAKALKARDDAEKAQADKYAKEDWEDGVDRFRVAAKSLESGRISYAEKNADQAEGYFRNAELDAIKTSYLTEARQLIAQAKENDIDRYAPVTLAKAEILLKEAEKELSENRYDIDRPRSLARNALYEARHAIYIHNRVKPVMRDDKTAEDLVLEFEQPITRIAGSLDLIAALDGPSTEITNSIVSQINLLQKHSYELNASKNEILSLETQIDQLEKSLGVQSQRLANQEESRKRFQRVERQFTEEEATVMTKGNQILVRLVGLSFLPGQATIQPEYFALLKKLEIILEEYPMATALLEGHTDSFGSDEHNLGLSQRRAEAVRAYLIANIEGRDGSSLQSIGYGESRPIGNNETPEGRAKNRRIDLVINMQ